MPSSYLSPGVYMEEVSSGSRPIEAVGTAVAAFVGFAEKGPVNEPVLVTNWTQFKQTFGDFVEGYYLAHAVYGYFLNGGGIAYVVGVGGAARNTDAAPAAEIAARGDGGRVALTIAARDPQRSDLTVEVAPASEPSEETFKLVVKQGGEPVETFDNVTTRRGSNNVVTVIRQRSSLISVVDVKGKTLEIPQHGEVALAAATREPATVGAQDYVGNSSDRTGFGGLEAVDDVTMLCVPDLMAALAGAGTGSSVAGATAVGGRTDPKTAAEITRLQEELEELKQAQQHNLTIEQLAAVDQESQEDDGWLESTLLGRRSTSAAEQTQLQRQREELERQRELERQIAELSKPVHSSALPTTTAPRRTPH